MSRFRVIPSIEVLLQRPRLRAAIARHGADAVTSAARDAADGLREQIRSGGEPPASAEAAVERLELQTLTDLHTRLRPSLRPVINATGVIVHTNLGRAPLAREAIARMDEIAAGYSNLEYDMDAGRRGHRHVHAERLLRFLTGADAALVVNNNAAAMLVILAALAAGREVVVSRGELVEIGGGFRVPEVLAQSGASIREVGTTNRTRVNDYAAAISDRTALLLRVHRSNFRIEGFTERPPLAELAALAHRYGLPLVEDLGSGWIGGSLAAPSAIGDEPSVSSSLSEGADLVAFSGDKLLGGPQAGIVVGSLELIGRLRVHPLMRAVRADKLVYAALEATLALWMTPSGRQRIPVSRMIDLRLDEIDRRAEAVQRSLSGIGGLRARVIDGISTIGGGSAPGSKLPTRLLAVAVDDLSAAALEARLRQLDPPIVARVQDDEVVIDLRTVDEADDPLVAAGIRAAVDRP